MRVAILSSVTACAGDVFQQLAGDACFRSTPVGPGFLTALAASDRRQRPADVDLVTQRARRPARRRSGALLATSSRH